MEDGVVFLEMLGERSFAESCKEQARLLQSSLAAFRQVETVLPETPVSLRDHGKVLVSRNLAPGQDGGAFHEWDIGPYQVLIHFGNSMVREAPKRYVAA